MPLIFVVSVRLCGVCLRPKQYGFHVCVLSRAKFCREFYADRVNPASYFASVARALHPATFSAEFCPGEYIYTLMSDD